MSTDQRVLIVVIEDVTTESNLTDSRKWPLPWGGTVESVAERRENPESRIFPVGS